MMLRASALLGALLTIFVCVSMASAQSGIASVYAYKGGITATTS